MSDLIDRDAAMKLRDTLADIIGAAPVSSIHSALSEYRKAIRALPAVEVGVTHLSFDQREPSFHAAGCVIGMYYIIESDVMIDPFKLERPGWLSIIGFPTLEAAKAAAQADYAARIRSALTLTPAPDAGKVQALVDAIEVLNAACDAMWNDHERLEENPGRFGQPYRLKEVHMKAISEAQQKLPAALAAMKEG